MIRAAAAGLAALAAAGLAAAPALAQPASGAVIAVVHVDIAPQPQPGGPARSVADTVARARLLLLDLKAGCSSAIGCRRFQVLEQLGRPNHFTLVETWDSRTALDGFESSDLWRRVHKDLEPMLGSPFDERLHEEVR